MVCCVMRKSAVSEMSHIWGTSRESVQYQEGRICSMKRRLCSMGESVQYKKGTSIVERQGIW